MVAVATSPETFNNRLVLERSLWQHKLSWFAHVPKTRVLERVENRLCEILKCFDLYQRGFFDLYVVFWVCCSIITVPILASFLTMLGVYHEYDFT
jgi:hypothetical protein